MTVRPEQTSAAELRARSADLLEFPRVRQALAAHTRLPISRDLALALEPTYDAEAVRMRAEETAEARVVLADAALDIGTERDARPVLRRAALQAVLNGEELVAVADTLALAVKARAALAGGSKAPRLRAIARNVPDLRALEREIRSKLHTSGEVRDEATPYLQRLRAEARTAYRHATDALDALMGQDAVSEALQERQITTRSERLVIPIKADFRGRIAGMVQDVSDSGATLFVEPMSTVNLTNAWREVTAAEQEETRRILRQLSVAVARRVSDISYALETVGRLDLVLAKARYAVALRAGPVEVSTHGLRLVSARHPLLPGPSRAAHPLEVVPLTLTLEPPVTGIAVTGPNMGGKTVALKTLGLMVLMHQAGLQLPCEPATRLPIVDGVYADIGDQQSIEQSVSTFSSHMSTIAAVLAHAGPRSLVLLDELGTGTDPDEGAALATAILAHLAAHAVSTLVTTHYREVAALAAEHPGLQNASVDLDPVTLKPTYRLTQGLPGRSYAMEVAERIGLDARVVAAARVAQDPAQRAAETLLADIHQERSRTRGLLQEAEAARERAEALQQELQRHLEEAARVREHVEEDTRQELRAQVREVQERIKQAEAMATWEAHRDAPPPPRVLEEARREVAEAQRLLRAQVWSRHERREDPPAQRVPLAVGDTVEVGTLGFTGTVLSAPDDAGQVEVQIGSAHVRLRAAQLRRVGSPEQPQRPNTSIRLIGDDGVLASGQELDLRGMRVHEALERLDAGLDQALAQGRGGVRVVHGKGTGALRHAVWEHLAGHRAVAQFDQAPRERGGEGATEVTLK